MPNEIEERLETVNTPPSLIGTRTGKFCRGGVVSWMEERDAKVFLIDSWCSGVLPRGEESPQRAADGINITRWGPHREYASFLDKLKNFVVYGRPLCVADLSARLGLGWGAEACRLRTELEEFAERFAGVDVCQRN